MPLIPVRNSQCPQSHCDIPRVSNPSLEFPVPSIPLQNSQSPIPVWNSQSLIPVWNSQSLIPVWNSHYLQSQFVIPIVSNPTFPTHPAFPNIPMAGLIPFPASVGSQNFPWKTPRFSCCIPGVPGVSQPTIPRKFPLPEGARTPSGIIRVGIGIFQLLGNLTKIPERLIPKKRQMRCLGFSSSFSEGQSQFSMLGDVLPGDRDFWDSRNSECCSHTGPWLGSAGPGCRRSSGASSRSWEASSSARG